ncbi:MAG: hypothetical protein KAT94_00505 [Candidatus Aenigmarchaeota archaeon]|nr:hypothetical protein [Candidatus Aenigmarchaeota archaeon]MCK4531326.1 hypothetical protein [Candidatus Aenigmarchaeota archaeon]
MPDLTIFIFICTFLIPEAIVLGWKRFLHSKYEVKNGTLNLLYHAFCICLLLFEFQASVSKTIILWGFISIAFVGIFTLLAGVMLGRGSEFVLYENRIYSSFKMFGHPYVIFPITMSLSFFMYIFPF